MSNKKVRWTLLLVFNLIFVGVLSFYNSSSAATQPGKQPFRNPVAQRQEMIGELNGIRLLLKEQNQLLRAIHQHNAKSKAKSK